MKVKEESEKVGSKLNIQETKIMASGPITSWETNGETAETVADFIFLGSNFTADDDRRHEIKRRLLLGRKVMTNLESISKNRDIALFFKFLFLLYFTLQYCIGYGLHWHESAMKLKDAYSLEENYDQPR